MEPKQDHFSRNRLLCACYGQKNEIYYEPLKWGQMATTLPTSIDASNRFAIQKTTRISRMAEQSRGFCMASIYRFKDSTEHIHFW